MLELLTGEKAFWAESIEEMLKNIIYFTGMPSVDLMTKMKIPYEN